MTSPLTMVERRAAAGIAVRFFSDAVFMPLVGAPVPCKAFLSSEQELQPQGLDTVRDARMLTILYLKEDLDEDLIEPESSFSFNEAPPEGTIFSVVAISENDGPIIGRVVVRNAD